MGPVIRHMKRFVFMTCLVGSLANLEAQTGPKVRCDAGDLTGDWYSGTVATNTEKRYTVRLTFMANGSFTYSAGQGSYEFVKVNGRYTLAPSPELEKQAFEAATRKTEWDRKFWSACIVRLMPQSLPKAPDADENKELKKAGLFVGDHLKQYTLRIDPPGTLNVDASEAGDQSFALRRKK
jgi:hypothetical protein